MTPPLVYACKWDAIKDQKFLSLEALGHLVSQVLYCWVAAMQCDAMLCNQ